MAGSTPTRQRAGQRPADTPRLEPLTGRYERRSHTPVRIEHEPIDQARRLLLAVFTAALFGVVVAAVVVVDTLTASRPEAVPAPRQPGPLFPCPTAKSDPLPNTFPRPQYVPMLIWNYNDYQATTLPANPGHRLGEVTCNIAAIAQTAGAYIPRPWPDGSSTAAPVGAAIHTQRGADPRCELALELPNGWFIFQSGNC
ncbi:hypothetical protein [Aestuariimicrobium sp. Y1814]|uniref:hypothetical protein n=1 Tax=Aestuariimicrobium sp. Y1814 TaxID=3418742 RepID=UPI003DA71B38